MEYFFRTDGTATLASAIGPASDISRCGNKALLEASTFSPDDIINISTNGGSFTDLTLTGDKINGVIIKGDGVYNTTSSNEALITLDGSSTAIENVEVQDYWVECTYVASNAASSFACLGDVSLTAIDCKARNLGGDGFSQISGGSGDVVYNGCIAKDCGSSRVTTESNQGFTAHTSTQTATLHDCTSDGCNMAVSFVGGSTCDWVSGSITGSLGTAIKADTGSSVTIRGGVTVDANVTTSRLVSVQASSTVTFDGATVNITDQATADAFIRGSLIVNGGNWLLASTNATIQAIITGSIEFNRVRIDARQFSRFVRTDGNANCSVVFNGCYVDLSNATSSPFIYMSGSADFDVNGNVFDSIPASGYMVDVAAASSTANKSVTHNTAYRASLGGSFMDDDSGIDCSNNIFVNINNVDNGITVPSYNCYFGSEDLGGTGSITTDPLFLDASSGDFRLGPLSPARQTGGGGGPSYTDSQGNDYTSTPNMGALSKTPAFVDLDPLLLRRGLVNAARTHLKPSLVTDLYTSGTPTSSDQIKPSLQYSNGILKEGLLDGSSLKSSFRKAV